MLFSISTFNNKTVTLCPLGHKTPQAANVTQGHKAAQSSSWTSKWCGALQSMLVTTVTVTNADSTAWINSTIAYLNNEYNNEDQNCPSKGDHAYLKNYSLI